MLEQFAVFDLDKKTITENTGVIDQNIDPAILFSDLIYPTLNGFSISYVNQGKITPQLPSSFHSGILVYIIYSNLLGVGRTLVEDGRVPAWLGLWWAHVLVLGGGFVLFFVQDGGVKRLARRWRSA